MDSLCFLWHFWWDRPWQMPPHLPELLFSGRGFLNASQWTRQCHPLAHHSFSWHLSQAFPLYQFLQVTVAQKGKQSIVYRQGAPQVSTVTARHGQPRSCGSTHILHNTDKHNTQEVFWSQNAIPDIVTGSICRHDVRMKNTIHKFKTPKSIFSKQLLNIAGVYQNNSLWMK